MKTWIKNLKVSHKIVLIIAAFVIPLSAATFYALTKGVNKDIQFAAQELKGDAFQRPLEALLDAIPQHQWLAIAAASGDRNAIEALDANEVAIDKIFADLDTVDNQFGKQLQFTPEELAAHKRQGNDPATVKANWQHLKAITGKGGATEIADAHKALIASVRTMITHAGDMSNLILDPDLDSSYLIDVVLSVLPQNQERLAEIVDYLNDSTKDGKIDAHAARRLSVFAAMLREADVDRANASAASALAEDANFYGVSESLQKNLPEPLKTFSSANTELADLLDQAAENPAAANIAALVASGKKAHEVSYSLWQAGIVELDNLFKQRVSALQKTRNLTIAGVLGTLVVSSLIAFFVMRNINNPLRALTLTSEKILRGDNTARAPVEGNDEIGVLADSFNRMVESRIQAQHAIEAENMKLQNNIQELLLVVSDASDGKLGVRARVSEGALGNVCDALNLMFENVGDLIKNAKIASNRVALAANQITAVSAELTAGEKAQVQQIDITSNGVRDLNQHAKLVLNNCQSANQAAQAAREAAEQGAAAVRSVIDGMERIRENVQANAKKIKRLGDRSLEIASIVKSIGEISAKTDMLALNASIEASRAGEQGRGFTVVAEQVRGLADQTRSLTNQVETLVTQIQVETAEAVAQMESQTQVVETGARSAHTAGSTLQNIVEASNQSSTLVSEINKAASLQARRADEMLTTVEAINSTAVAAQQKVQQTRQTSEQLVSLSAQLDKELAKFIVQSLGKN